MNTTTPSLPSISEIYLDLVKQSTLEPTDTVSRLFSDLVTSVLHEPQKQACDWLHEEQIAHLQSICGQGEFSLELYWSKKISTSPDPWQSLQEFPYFKNYVALTKLEWQTLQSCKQHTEHNIVFCGGGPLPLTAILIAEWFAIPITILDSNREAVIQARSLIESLGLHSLINAQHCTAQAYTNYAAHNSVYVAALAGSDASVKRQIFATIRQQVTAHAHVLTRSSWDARTLLYQPLDMRSIPGFRIQKEIRPAAPIINSILILTPDNT